MAAGDAAPRTPRCAFFEGYSLHANLAVHERDRRKLERLLRYGLRPPFAQKRLSLTPDGRVRLELRKPYYSGQTAIVLQPRELLRRLIATIPPCCAAQSMPQGRERVKRGRGAGGSPAEARGPP